MGTAKGYRFSFSAWTVFEGDILGLYPAGIGGIREDSGAVATKNDGSWLEELGDSCLRRDAKCVVGYPRSSSCNFRLSLKPIDPNPPSEDAECVGR